MSEDSRDAGEANEDSGRGDEEYVKGMSRITNKRQ